jgi:hypothetical protein
MGYPWIVNGLIVNSALVALLALLLSGLGVLAGWGLHSMVSGPCQIFVKTINVQDGTGWEVHAAGQVELGVRPPWMPEEKP